MKIETLPILLACNASSRDAAIDRLNGQALVIWKGNGVTISGAAFVGDPLDPTKLVTDFSNVVSASLVVRANNAAGTVLVNKTVAVGNFDTTLTHAEFLAGQGHFNFVLTGADTNQTTDASGRLVIYFAIELQTTDPDPITICVGTGEIREDGIGNAAAPTTPDYEAWTKAQSDARYVQSANLGSIVPNLRLDLTTLTGGGATALDGIPTVGLTTPRMVMLVLPGGPLSVYVLESGTAAESSPATIRPDDYHASTNAKVWQRKL